MISITEEWDNYMKKSIPAEAGNDQVTDLQNTFFAGAWVMFGAMMDAVNIQEGEEHLAEEKMAALEAEVITQLTKAVFPTRQLH